MSVYKRQDSEYYWYKFKFKGRLYQRPAKVKNKRAAEGIEAAFRTQLAKGEYSIEDRKPAPTLREFAQTFIDFVQTRHANKPGTVNFYSNRLKRLLEWETLRETRLDRIDEALIAKYIGFRRKSVGIVAVNRELATLRRVLHIAHDWKVIRSIPKVRLLPGEQSRDFVLDHEMEERYLKACPPVLHDVSVVLIGSALRLGEALNLQWADVHLEPVGKARYGWLQVREGKSKNAHRTVPLAARVGQLLAKKREAHASERTVFNHTGIVHEKRRPFVFAVRDGRIELLRTQVGVQLVPEIRHRKYRPKLIHKAHIWPAVGKGFVIFPLLVSIKQPYDFLGLQSLEHRMRNPVAMEFQRGEHCSVAIELDEMLETATGRLATTEVNVGLRPRTTLTVPSWPPLIEHVE